MYSPPEVKVGEEVLIRKIFIGFSQITWVPAIVEAIVEKDSFWFQDPELLISQKVKVADYGLYWRKKTFYIHLDLSAAVCAGDSKKSDSGYEDAVELNLYVTLSRYLKGFVESEKTFKPDAQGNRCYKDYLTNECKLNKKEREEATRKILQSFDPDTNRELENKFKQMKEKTSNSFLLPSAKKLLVHLKKLHEEEPGRAVVCLHTFEENCGLLEIALKELKMELLVVKLVGASDLNDFAYYLNEIRRKPIFRILLVKEDFKVLPWKLFPLMPDGHNIFFHDTVDGDIVDPQKLESDYSYSKFQGNTIFVNMFTNVVDEDYLLAYFSYYAVANTTAFP